MGRARRAAYIPSKARAGVNMSSGNRLKRDMNIADRGETSRASHRVPIGPHTDRTN
jgi:hypothetical protein